MPNDPNVSPTNPEERFTAAVIARCRSDKGLAARLRHADNPDTSYQSWEFLAAWHVDLERETQRLPFATVAAAISRTKPEHNGSLSLGRALAACYAEGHSPKETDGSDPIKARLRRLLACSDLREVCRVLRPLLTLIESRVSQPLDYARLLRQLRRFHYASDQVKAQWAQEFYSARVPAGEPE